MSTPTDQVGSVWARVAKEPRVVVIGLSCLIAIVLSATVLATGFDPIDADIKYDWLVAKESVRQGGDAYRDLLLIAKDEGVQISVHAGEGTERLTGHPRSPGAIFIQLPLLAIPYDQLYVFSTFAALVAFGFLVATFDVETMPRMGVIALGVGLVSAPLFITLRYAGQAALVAALALIGWRVVQTGREYTGGVLIGLSAVLKIFPAFLVFPLLIARKWRAAVSLFVTGLLANLLGLRLPGVSLSRSLEELAKATDTWIGLSANGSLVRRVQELGLASTSAQLIALALLAGFIVIAWLLTRGSPDRGWVSSPFAWITIGLLAIPLSWISYDLAFFPAVLLIAVASSRLQPVGLFCLGLWAIPVVIWPMEVIASGGFATIVRVVVAVTAITAAHRLKSWEMFRTSPNRHGGLQGELQVVDQRQP